VDLSKIQAGRERSRQMLRTALGPLLLARLEDPGVAEVMLNPDGRVWIDRFDAGLVDAGLSISADDAERILRLVAHHVAAEIHADQPRLSAELPGTGECFEGLMPPLAAAPTFSIRKPASLVFRRDDYVRAGIMTEREGQVLAGAPRAIALVNGTLAAALGLGLWLWIVGLIVAWSAMDWPSAPRAAIRRSSTATVFSVARSRSPAVHQLATVVASGLSGRWSVSRIEVRRPSWLDAAKVLWLFTISARQLDRGRLRPGALASAVERLPCNQNPSPGLVVLDSAAASGGGEWHGAGWAWPLWRLRRGERAIWPLRWSSLSSKTTFWFACWRATS